MKRIEEKKKDKLGQDMEARKVLELYGTPVAQNMQES